MCFQAVKCDQCPGKIGINNETSVTCARNRRFYLNTAAPATCSGTVTSWRYCYYPQNTIRTNQDFYATLAVYRPMTSANGSVFYANVSNLLTITLPDTQLRDGFKCSTFNSTTVDIEAGDVVGACIFNPESGPAKRPLDLVGTAQNCSILYMGKDECSLSTIPSRISRAQLSNDNSKILHLYANIKSMLNIS